MLIIIMIIIIIIYSKCLNKDNIPMLATLNSVMSKLLLFKLLDDWIFWCIYSIIVHACLNSWKKSNIIDADINIDKIVSVIK